MSILLTQWQITLINLEFLCLGYNIRNPVFAFTNKYCSSECHTPLASSTKSSPNELKNYNDNHLWVNVNRFKKKTRISLLVKFGLMKLTKLTTMSLAGKQSMSLVGIQRAIPFNLGSLISSLSVCEVDCEVVVLASSPLPSPMFLPSTVSSVWQVPGMAAHDWIAEICQPWGQCSIWGLDGHSGSPWVSQAPTIYLSEAVS